MKPFVQKLPLPENSSFVAKTFTETYFEVGSHQHTEYELILFTEGSGVVYIDQPPGESNLPAASFEAGDIYFLGSNLPHAFQSNGNQPVSAVVVLFRANCFGTHFFDIPECRAIKQLLQISGHGLLIKGNNQYPLQHMIKMLETATGVIRINLLLHSLHLMSMEKENVILARTNIPERNYNNGESIDKVMQFTMASFQDRISLSQVAAVACMSVPSFCHYFKRHIHKTYIDFLNEVRIEYACRQLLQTNIPVAEICYDSGFNTITHFHRQFLKLKKITPLQYRKTFSMEMRYGNGENNKLNTAIGFVAA